MNDKWSQFAARNAWWLSGVAVLVTFDLLMVLSSFWPRFFSCTDGDTFFEALSMGNVGLAVVMLFSSILLFWAAKGTSRWRRVRLFVLGTVWALVWGWQLWSVELPDVFHPGWKFPIAVDGMFYLGLPLLWSLSLIFAALIWKPQSLRYQIGE